MATVLIILLCMLGLGFCVSILHSSWVGRRVGTTPYCNKCGYNLSGRTGEASPCSECGSDLTAKGSVRIGERKRRWGVFAPIALLLIGGFVFIPLQAVGVFRNFKVNSYKPVWYLSWESELICVAPQHMIPAPMEELIRRQEKGELSKSQIDALIQRVLRIQADSSKSWNQGWGDILEQAWLNGQVSENHLDAYLDQLAKGAHVFRVRPRVAPGHEIPVRIDKYLGRCGTTCGFMPVDPELSLSIRGTGINRICHVECDGSGYLEPGFSWIGHKLALTEIEWQSLPPGRYEIEAKLQLEIIDYDSSAQRQIGQFPRLYKVKFQHVLPFEVVSANEVAIAISHDPAKRPLAKVDWLAMGKADDGTDEVNGHLRLHAEYIDTAFDVFCRINGSEFPVAYVDFEKRNGIQGIHFDSPIGQIPGEIKTANIILRPNPARAEKSVGLMEIWGEPIEILNVPVRR